MSGNFALRLQAQRALIYDLRVTLESEPRFFIFEADPAKHAAFTHALMQKDAIRLEEYGTILLRGWGEPDEAMKADLHARFGLYDSRH